MTDLTEQVLNSIRTHRVSMRSKAYFMVRTIALLCIGTLALVLAILLLSFVFFTLHRTGELLLLGFGAEGLRSFFVLFPWTLLGVVIFLLVGFQELLRRYGAGYKFPILEVFAALVGLSALVSLLVTLSPMHAYLEGEAVGGRLPLLAPAYQTLHHPRPEGGEFWGIVSSVGTSTVTIVHDDNDVGIDEGTSTVRIPAGADVSRLHPGDRIFIGGHRAGDEIQAFGFGVRATGKPLPE